MGADSAYKIGDITMNYEFIVTYSGEEFYPTRPEINKIHIEDIAHSLSLLCRANGHISHFYSIAQHSINCANEAKARGYPAKMQLACLIHDSSEAYISDITRPVKQHLSEYKKIEKVLQDTIYVKFIGALLTSEEFSVVNDIDNELLVFELNSLMKARFIDKKANLHAIPSIEPRDFLDVENEFLKLYYGIMHAGVIQGR